MVARSGLLTEHRVTVGQLYLHIRLSRVYAQRLLGHSCGPLVSGPGLLPSVGGPLVRGGEVVPDTVVTVIDLQRAVEHFSRVGVPTLEEVRTTQIGSRGVRRLNGHGFLQSGHRLAIPTHQLVETAEVAIGAGGV